VEFLEWTYYSNSVRGWLLALLFAAVVLLGLLLVRAVAERQLNRLAGRTATDVDDVLLAALRRTRPWFLFTVSVWAGSLSLVLPRRLVEVLGTLAVLVTLVQIGLWAHAAISRYVASQSERTVELDPARITTMRAIGFLASVAVWTVVLLVGLDNVGIDVTALIAGLGVGGIAVALALQNILGDLFASLSIVLDKPFVYGDFIVVDDMAGTVDHVGLKTTRVKSLSGEQLIFSNSDLLRSRVRNYKRMAERRVVFKLGVTYQTPRAMLERIPEMLSGAVDEQPDTRLDRAHFSGFGPSSLDFEVVYFVLGSDYGTYMDRQQAINLEVVRRFEDAGVEFAYPTQTLFVTRTTATT
jgi:small-conductance mechanosensitive channel